MSEFLDKTGLSYFWDKIKSYIGDQTASFIPYNRYISTTFDANTWLTNGYRNTSMSTTNLPPECTGNDRWGILFFLAENEEDGTGTQMFFPIDGTNKGRVYSRSLTRMNVESSVVGDWKRLITSDEFIPGYMDVADLASYDGEGYIDGDDVNQYQLCSATISGVGSTALELSRQLIRVRFPAELSSSDVNVALRVNNGPYYRVTVFNGTFSTVRSMPITGMLIGRTVPLSMLYVSNEGQWVIDNYTVPYGSSVVRYIWKVGAGGTGANNAEEARANLGIPEPPYGIEIGGTGATNAATARSNLGAAEVPIYRSVTLSSYSWSNNQQTKIVSGISGVETDQLIQIVPKLSSLDAFMEAGILCTAQDTDMLTFTCETLPTATIYVYVVIQDVKS